MRVAFIFPGQGSQQIGMGSEFYANSSAAKVLLDNASKDCDIDFATLLFKENDILNISEFTQPAIVLNSLMAYAAFAEKCNLTAKFALGHSLGEFSALAISGALDIADTLKLVNSRGKFMARDCEGVGAGMMVILGLSDEKVEDICVNSHLDVWAANYNCDGQIVVAGIKDHLARLEPVFKESGAKRAMLLNMSVASHCELLKNASENLAVELEKVLKNQFLPVISNVTAHAYTTKSEALDLLKRQLISPVLYKQSIKNIENDVDCFIEFGASILKGLNKKITTKPTYSVFDSASLDETLKAIS